MVYMLTIGLAPGPRQMGEVEGDLTRMMNQAEATTVVIMTDMVVATDTSVPGPAGAAMGPTSEEGHISTY